MLKCNEVPQIEFQKMNEYREDYLTTGQTMLETDNHQYHTQVSARTRFSRQIKRGAKLRVSGRAGKKK